MYNVRCHQRGPVLLALPLYSRIYDNSNPTGYYHFLTHIAQPFIIFLFIGFDH